MKQLSKAEIAGACVGGGVGVILIVFLIAYAITTRNKASTYSGSVVVPPINPDGDTNVQPVKTTVCAPTTKGFDGLVACASSAMCTGCKEYTDPSNPYQCVAVTGGNGAVDATGRLVQPQVVTYKAPSSSTARCLGRNTKQPDAVPCACDPPYTGANCELMQISITQPGAYCLPSYAATCNSPTTDSVLTNANTGKGGEYTCACKPEYKGLFYQSVEGGLCDQPLICGAGNPQMEADQKTVKQYQVYTGTDAATGTPQFADKPVYTNRITSYKSQTTEPCVAKTTGFQTVNDNGIVPYQMVTLDAHADPTCQVELISNKCTAVSSSAPAGFNTAIVRGSNAPGDPLVKRVSPAFFPPVPPGLQRCPDNFSGSGTPSDPCVCACKGAGCWCDPGAKLLIMPTKKSYCQGTANKDDTDYTGTWHSSMFDATGEWNGAFTCVNDLAGAQVQAGSIPFPVSGIKWRSVNENRVREVQCLESTAYTYRDEYNADTQSYPVSKTCVGPQCEGVSGTRVKDWDGYRDGPLVNEQGLPWFKAGTGQTFGGQCSCEGVAYRGTEATTGVSALKMVPSFYNVLGDKQSWWNCVQDTCASPSRPHAYLDTTSDNWQRYPRCVCNTEPSTGPPFKTSMSFADTGNMPTCIDDPCNPDGFHTTSDIDCVTNTDCGGICYANKCHYPLSSSQACTSDADCIRLGIGASTTATCAMLPGAKNKVCLYQDKDREAAGTTCMTNEDCSYGVCTAYNTLGTSSTGKCSGGCACSKTSIQQPDNSNPVGFTCRSRCDEVSPCFNGGKCSINWKGEQVCECPPCYTGSRCEVSGNGSRLGEHCVYGRKADEENRGIGVCCDPNTECSDDICKQK